jgi:hypothetical protein
MADELEISKRTMKQVLTECGQAGKKLQFQGPDNIRPDSRHSIKELAEDHVVFSLLGDEDFVVPYGSIVALKVGQTSLVVRYR